MIETKKLEDILEKCRIIKSFAALPNHILGHYSYDGRYYIILINKVIGNNERLYRTVLAEEIGHYRTTIGDITPRKYMCLKDRLIIDKKELLALRWATDFLLPTDMIIEFLNNRVVVTIDYLADYFMVTEDFILKKLEFMAKEKGLWQLSNGRILCLFNLPSVFVYEG